MKQLARYLSDNLREEEIICHFGGEEFLVIMPNTEVNEVIKLACRLRRGVEALNI